LALPRGYICRSLDTSTLTGWRLVFAWIGPANVFILVLFSRYRTWPMGEVLNIITYILKGSQSTGVEKSNPVSP
jgi:hypothetical protein